MLALDNGDKGMPPSFSEGVRFTLGNTELPGHIDRLRSVDRVDLVVVLSHLGFAQDARLAAEMAQRVAETVAPHRDFLDQVVGRAHSPLDRATSLEASMDNVLLDAIAAAAGTHLAFSSGWRYGAPILPGDVTMQHLWNIVPTHPPVSTAVRARHPGARQPARQRGGGLTGRTLRGASGATTNRPPRHALGGHGCVRHPTDSPSSGHYRSVRCPCNGHGTSRPTPMKSALSQRSMHHAKRAKVAQGVRT
mgnify:FL=1